MRGEVVIRHNTIPSPDGQRISRFLSEFTRGPDYFIDDFNLENLSELETYKRLDLSGNRFSNLDLSPLRRCHELEHLCISDNRLSSIDLSPLEYCAKLRILDLSYNRLTNIDLHPIGKLRKLEMLFVHSNHIEEINLTPLIYCRSLQHVYIEGWEKWPQPFIGLLPHSSKSYEESVLLELMIQELYPPWVATFPTSIYQNHTSSKTVIEQYGWKQMKEFLSEFYDIIPRYADISLQKGFLQILGMDELACYEGEFGDIIDLIPESDDYESGKREMYTRMVDLLKQQLIRGGSTLFFDIDALKGKEGVLLAPLILERRKKEIKELVLKESEDMVDLSSLWQTGYGFEILQAMKKGLKVTKQEFRIVKRAFAELGIKLKTDPKIEHARDTLSPILRSFVMERALRNAYIS